MENQYGIAIKNRFLTMVDIDDDPLEFLKQQEAAKTKKEKSSKSKQSGKKVANAPSEGKVKEQNAQRKEEKERVNSAKPSERGGRGGRREPREIRENDGERRPHRRQGPREYRDNRGGDENVPPEFRERPEGSSGGFNREGGERGRGRGRGRGGFRGGRGGRGGGFRDNDRERGERQGFGAPPGSKRDFDRHSGSDKTGVKAVEKKEGGGARNWGSYKDDLAEPQETEERAPAEETTENFELNESAEGEQPAGESEDQPKQMTLDEWKALQKNERSKPKYKIRKAGEGEEAQWSKGTAYTKKRTGSEDEDEEDEDDEFEDEKRHGNKNLLDIKITFNDPVRRGRGGRRPRDGRGRGRGGSGRGERKPRDSAPRMDDENDFPRLVKTEA
ncbi:plasminogen activator inhibitor 1 RNA-binding protein-like isoform X1 [Haliotis rufescens]|uniref:plasminogen activator inhibitor 1 RNA-binding protein-like isoform X1 n=1 Tax=Haliotis rufescens TaxID=6454 RepID=UPI001EB056A0|nr:plasminogen activator inhibitor 1 RNA-binding protein-like isoform X1 [Haliotis rufescens]